MRALNGGAQAQPGAGAWHPPLPAGGKWQGRQSPLFRFPCGCRPRSAVARGRLFPVFSSLPMSAQPFVHLRLHSEFSVVDGTLRIDEAVKLAARSAQPALAVTDLNNMFGAVKLYKAARGKGVQPILGAEVTLEGLGEDKSALSRVLLLAQNHDGYLNLSELLARAWTQGAASGQAVARWPWHYEIEERRVGKECRSRWSPYH